MLLLVTKAARTLRTYGYPPEQLGRLVQPRHYPNLNDNGPMWWAADNDCFNGGLDEVGFRKMLAAIMAAPRDRLLFVTAPDVVADAAATAEAFEEWEPQLHALGLPVAFVAQDGLEVPPWDRFEALFVGGSTEYKKGLDAARLIREAKRRGKHVHVGRINSVARALEFAAQGADSCDGTTFSKWTDAHLPRFVERMRGTPVPGVLPL